MNARVRISLRVFLLVLLMSLCAGCTGTVDAPQVAATTLPVYEFTTRLCQGTGIRTIRLVTENVSCLHDYTLQVSQMRAIESAEVVVCSGAGLEDFLADALRASNAVIDASENVPLLCNTEEHDHEHSHGHSHSQDPHIWLSPANAKIMAQNICNGLSTAFPDHSDIFVANLQILNAELDVLDAYGSEQLSGLACRDLITFHDGFSYFADAFDLEILQALEEESGSEASASEIIALAELVQSYSLPAIFTEKNGSVSAASILKAELGISVFSLDMAMTGDSYFDAMYHNINTVKEALG